MKTHHPIPTARLGRILMSGALALGLAAAVAPACSVVAGVGLKPADSCADSTTVISTFRSRTTTVTRSLVMLPAFSL